MPTRIAQTMQDRIERLDRIDRRCDGNNRRCVLRAVEQYTLLPADDFIIVPGAEPITRQSCSRHRQQFVNNANFAVDDITRLA